MTELFLGGFRAATSSVGTNSKHILSPALHLSHTRQACISRGATGRTWEPFIAQRPPCLPEVRVATEDTQRHIACHV